MASSVIDGPPTDEAVACLVSRIVSDIHSSMLNLQLQKAAQSEVIRSNARGTDVKKSVIQALSKSGWEKKLRNAVFRCMMTYVTIPHPLAPPDQQKEPISYIRRAQMNWEKRILKSLNSMCTELGVPLAKRRPEKEQREMMSRWSELGTDEPDLSKFRPVYAPKDFLEVIAGLKNPNMVDCGDTTAYSCMWGIIQVPLKVKDIHQLRIHFSEMSINQCQNGVDDSSNVPIDLFENERARLAKKVIASGHTPAAQEYAKKGCPSTFRAQIWELMLGTSVDDTRLFDLKAVLGIMSRLVLSGSHRLVCVCALLCEASLSLSATCLKPLASERYSANGQLVQDIMYYEQLKNYVYQHDMLVDNLIYKDVKLTATNDDQYFVFEDYLYMILLPFSRDTVVLQHFKQSSATPAKSYIRGRMGVEDYAVNYPPNGVIPFHGFAMYVAPLCYVYNDPVQLYFVFRELYMRYFFRLHTLSSHPQGIVSLCLLFETLLQTYEPQLFYHLKTVKIQPLRIAFKWLIRAFSGFLASDQVLLLWDRILAYNSLEILPVLAMSIFSFRKTNLMQIQTSNAAEAVLADITTLKVIPLIQLTLFSQ